MPEETFKVFVGEQEEPQMAPGVAVASSVAKNFFLFGAALRCSFLGVSRGWPGSACTAKSGVPCCSMLSESS